MDRKTNPSEPMDLAAAKALGYTLGVSSNKVTNSFFLFLFLFFTKESLNMVSVT